LYVCKGKRVVRIKQVWCSLFINFLNSVHIHWLQMWFYIFVAQIPFARSSLNHDDVFILDTQDKIYQFNGANSNIQERAKALEVIQLLKEKYHEGTCNVAIVGKDTRRIFSYQSLKSLLYNFASLFFRYAFWFVWN
jgi:hypothetical protein